MVLSLFDICRVCLRNSIENGRFPDWRQLPPIRRQSILDLVLLHGTIDEPNCVQILGSIEFLQGFTNLDTRKGAATDNRFLDRVAQSLATIFTDVTTIGSDIENLHLNLYFHRPPNPNSDTTWNFVNAISLISQCPRLRSLVLRLTQNCSFPENESVSAINIRGLLNCTGALRPCSSVIENLTEFSFEGFFFYSILINNVPIIQFKNLTSLTVNRCCLHRIAWRLLLESVQETLANLHLEDLFFDENHGSDKNFIQWSDPALPLPLRRLRRFYFDAAILIDDNTGFLKNLAECESLEYARVPLKLSNKLDGQVLACLASINSRARLDIKFVANRDCRTEDFETCLQFVDSFGSSVSELQFNIDRWTPESAMAFGHGMQNCPNLESLDLEWTASETDDSQTAESSLLALLENPDRAGRLRSLALRGGYQFSGAVFDAISRTCLNLEKLDIRACQNLTDGHLINWANNGAMPRELSFYRCRNFGDDGLITVLEKSGSRLTKFTCRGIPKITKRTWYALIEHCPNAALHNCDMTGALTKKWVNKRFRGPSDYEVTIMKNQ